MKIILISIKTRKKKLMESINEMKKLNFNKELVRHYEEQLKDVGTTLQQEEEHDKKQELLFKQQEYSKIKHQ